MPASETHGPYLTAVKIPTYKPSIPDVLQYTEHREMIIERPTDPLGEGLAEQVLLHGLQ
jgi:hypothetical protein